MNNEHLRRVLQDIVERVGAAVARPVWNRERFVVEHAHESGRVPFRRDVGAARGVRRRDQHEWRPCDHGTTVVIERRHCLGHNPRLRLAHDFAELVRVVDDVFKSH